MINMNKAIFLDRDGTINIDYGYVYKIEDFKFIDGAVEGLKILYDLGYKLIVISNQSGIARGYCKTQDVDKLFEYMKNELKNNGVELTDVYYCPHLNEPCSCRKPKLGMFYKAMKEHNIDFNMSYAIGDKERDIAIIENENLKAGIILDKGINNGNKIYLDSLLDAAKYIKEQENIK